VPGVAVAVTAPKLPALVPPERLNPKAPPANRRPRCRLRSTTTTVTRSVPPAVTVGLAKLTVEFAALIV